jgi:hypothetical protein
MRRDYELALQLGNKPAWDAFLAQHPDGFYASLARLQLEKIAAEQAHLAAAEKARQAEAERARLAAEGAQKGAQARADADARAAAIAANQAAEQARLAAEKAQQQPAEAERQRTNPATAGAADNAAARAAGNPPASDKGVNVAALTAGLAPSDLTRSVQDELRRVGCLSGAADGNWSTASRRSLSLFNRYAGTKFDVKVASTDALDAIKLKQSRVCPLVCEKGYKADGDHCTRIVCGDGYVLNGDNECEKKRAKPAATTAKRDSGAGQDRDRETRAPARPQASAQTGRGGGGSSGSNGQIYCDGYLCRPVARGCHLDYRGGGGASGGNVEVCN